jgi:hypothetical protein
MHLIENSKDKTSANTVGLEIGDDEICEECFKSVGDTKSNFVPFVFLLDDEAEWIVCAECASPVL